MSPINISFLAWRAEERMRAAGTTPRTEAIAAMSVENFVVTGMGD
jgi:hypothetical protein